MNIVVIDDGVNEKYFNMKPLKHDIEVDRNQKLYVRSSKNELICSHGTICAAIILKYAPNAVISSIKVLNTSEGRGMKEQLILALQWCLENYVQIINLSIGSTQLEDFKELRSMVTELYRKGCLIIAAYNNRNVYTIPASLECVIGVKCNPALRTPSYQVCTSKYEFFIEASSNHEFINFYHKKFVSSSANSYAAPYITAVVHNIMTERNCYNFNDICKSLLEKEKNILCYVPDIIDQAVVVDLTEHEITELFYFSVKEVYNEKTIEEIVKENDFVNIVVLAESDYFMTQLMKVFVKINQYIRGIYCCFKMDCDKFIENDLYERIWMENYYIDKFACKKRIDINITNHLESAANNGIQIGEDINIPLIYIYGERELLIRLLLDIENRFLKEGYAIKVIGEFQCAYLYGFDYIDSVENRKSVINNVENRYKPDIIICGIDSPQITYDGEDMCFDLECERKLSGKDKKFIYCSDTIYSRIIATFE